MSLEEFQRAVSDRNWYAVGAIVLWAVVWLWRRYDPVLYPKIPARAQWLVPIALAAAAGFVDAFMSKLPIGEAAFRALFAAVSMGVGSMGIHSALQNSPVPYAGLTASERDKTGGDTTPKPPLDDRDTAPARSNPETEDTPVLRLSPSSAFFIAVISIVSTVLPLSCGVFGGKQAESAATKASCSDEALGALKELHKRAAVAVVESGKCDAYKRVDDCPAYSVIEAQFKLAAKPWEHCPMESQ